jgi:uncharacterized OB-fold protein
MVDSTYRAGDGVVGSAGHVRGVLPQDWAVPAPDACSREWFTSGTLAVQCCSACAALQHPPEEICHACGSIELGTRVLAPRGTVHSYTVVHYAANPALADAVPYTVVLVSLDDAPELRVVGNLLEGEARLAMAVRAVWEERTVQPATSDISDDGGTAILLPQWVPA